MQTDELAHQATADVCPKNEKKKNWFCIPIKKVEDEAALPHGMSIGG